MKLKNCVIEWAIINGSLDSVGDIVFEHSSGQRNQPEILYVLVGVEFPKSTIPGQNKWFVDKPSARVPIHVVSDQCEKRWCMMNTSILRVCNTIIIHKYQGMIIGSGHEFEKVVVCLPEPSYKKTPGLEIVDISRAMNSSYFSIGNSSVSISTLTIKKNGTKNTYE